MTQRLVIGLCGPEGAGKSTVAKLLTNKFEGELVPFASPLKRMLSALGVSDRHLYGTPDEKEEPLGILGGKSARQAMQLLGTEWGRDAICADLWVRAWHVAVSKKAGWLIVADDLRFQNEADAIKALGGVVVCVLKKPAALATSDLTNLHRSQEFFKIPRDHIIVNDGSLEDLDSMVWRLMQHLHAEPQVQKIA